MTISIRKVVEHFKIGLMDNTSRNKKDKGV